MCDHVCSSEKYRSSANPPAVAPDNKDRWFLYLETYAREAVRVSHIRARARARVYRWFWTLRKRREIPQNVDSGSRETKLYVENVSPASFVTIPYSDSPIATWTTDLFSRQSLHHHSCALLGLLSATRKSRYKPKIGKERKLSEFWDK